MLCFANCLDNAIEACTRIPQKKFINVVAYIKNEYLYVRIDNSAGKAEHQVKRIGHGWGLKIIRDVVEKYNGMMRIFPAGDGVFSIEIALKPSKQPGGTQTTGE